MPTPSERYNEIITDARNQILDRVRGDLTPELRRIIAEELRRARDEVEQGAPLRETYDQALRRIDQRVTDRILEEQRRAAREEAGAHEEAALAALLLLGAGATASALADASGPLWGTQDGDLSVAAPEGVGQSETSVRALVRSSIEDVAEDVDDILAAAQGDDVDLDPDLSELLDGIDRTEPSDVADAVTGAVAGDDLADALRRVGMDVDARGGRLEANLRRILSHEVANAADDAGKRLAAQSGAVDLVEWTLSLRHDTLPSSPDVCDVLAAADPFGYGPGRYHPEAVPVLPHPHCVVPDTEVQGSCARVFRSYYRGEVIQVTTREGNEITLTPNHPVPTVDRGYVPVSRLRKGDDLLRYSSEVNRSPLVSSDVSHSPVTAEEAFHTVAEESSCFTIEGAPEHFHGDGRRVNGNIDVVGVDGTLLRHVQALRNKYGREALFVLAKRVVALLCSTLNSTRPVDLLLFVQRLSAPALVGWLNKVFCSPFGLDLFPGKFPGLAFRSDINATILKARPESLPGGINFRGQRLEGLAVLITLRKLVNIWDLNATSFGSASNLNLSRYETPSDTARTDAQFVRNGLLASTGAVFTDDVVDIKVKRHEGYVYDLETMSGNIIANNLLVSNCECRINAVLIEPDDWPADRDVPERPEAEAIDVEGIMRDTDGERTVTEAHVSNQSDMIDRAFRLAYEE